ncbi:MAG TPA: asparagine--tRNA ligase [Candidatus Absconditabacterales bacterium]|nr:asparagine--tRNA ligase [Candidatus Absconditabacterales bacterium]HNG97403.1 asparagine--tRNA ligase [Candidatus Absconditabacterales bacterium]
MQTLISTINSNLVGQSITVMGWIQNIRSSGKLCFIELRDGSGYMQCVSEINTLSETLFKELESCGIETSLSLTGIVSKHPKKDEYELQVSAYHIICKTNDYPLGTKDDHGPEFLFDNRHLYLRSKSQRAIQRVRDTIIHATYDWMRNNGFTKIDAPIFTPNACEGTTELYSVEHVNGEIMYLTQSGQLYIEAAMYGVGRVFDFGPVFRAEQSKTRRHLNEFWMMDAEIPFIQQEENMQIQEDLLKYIIGKVLEINGKELALLDRDTKPLENIITIPWKRMTHREFVDDLITKGFDVKQGDDIGSDIEMQYMSMVDTPIFLTHFPLGIKAFYTKEDPAMPGYALCSDLLAPEGCGEVIGSSTRDDNYDVLLKKIKDHGLDPAIFDWYLDLRKYGSVPHAGFGYGLERLVRRFCGLHHIRETIPFPRYANRIRP